MKITYRCGHEVERMGPPENPARVLCEVCRDVALNPEAHTLQGAYPADFDRYDSFANDDALRRSYGFVAGPCRYLGGREALVWAIDNAVRKERDRFVTTPDVLFMATVLRSWARGVYSGPERAAWGQKRERRTEEERLAWARSASASKRAPA